MMGRVEWALLFALSCLWGGSFFFAKIAVAEIPPMSLVAIRVSVASAALLIYLRALGRKPPSGARLWGAFLGLGLVNNVLPFSLIFFGQQTIGAGLASILNAATPIFVMLVAHVFTADERLAAHKALGVGLGLAGVAALIGPEAFAVDLRGSATPLAMAACVAAAVSYGFGAVYSRRFSAMGVAPAGVAFGQVAASTLIAAPIAFAVDGGLDASAVLASAAALSPAAVAAALGLALVSTALAYVIFFRVLAAGGATYVSLVTVLVPATAVLLGALFLGERLGAGQALGFALIAAGLLCVDGGAAFKRRRGGV